MSYHLTVRWCRKGEEKHEATLAQEWIVHRGPQASEPHARQPVWSGSRLRCRLRSVSGVTPTPSTSVLSLPQQDQTKVRELHATMQLGVKVGCGCHRPHCVGHVSTCSSWRRNPTCPPVLPSRPLLHALFLLKPGSFPSMCISSAVRHFHHLCSGSGNQCTKGLPSCWLAEMWKMGVCSEWLAEVEAGR